jgi:hypothetical protein
MFPPPEISDITDLYGRRRRFPLVAVCLSRSVLTPLSPSDRRRSVGPAFRVAGPILPILGARNDRATSLGQPRRSVS